MAANNAPFIPGHFMLGKRIVAFLVLPLLLGAVSCCQYGKAPMGSKARPAHECTDNAARTAQASSGPLLLSIEVSDTVIPIAGRMTARVELRNVSDSPQVINLNGIEYGALTIWDIRRRNGPWGTRDFIDVIYQRGDEDDRLNFVVLQPGDYYGTLFQFDRDDIIGDYVLTAQYRNAVSKRGAYVLWQGTVQCKIPDIRVVPTEDGFASLVERARHGRSAEERAYAVSILALNQLTPAIPVLLEVMANDSSEEVRSDAASGIQEFADEPLYGQNASCGGARVPDRNQAAAWARKYVAEHPENLRPTEEVLEAPMSKLGGPMGTD